MEINYGRAAEFDSALDSGFGRIMNHLKHQSPARFRISFVETNIIFAVPAQARNKPEGVGEMPDARLNHKQELGNTGLTNVVRSECVLWPGGGKLIQSRFDLLGIQTHRSGIRFGDNYLEKFTTEVRQDKFDTLRSGWGEIRNRQPSDFSGLPLFLSKQSLHEFISNCKLISLGFEQASAAGSIYKMNLVASVDALVRDYCVHFDQETLDPVAINTYLPNGILYSTTTLSFRVGTDGAKNKFVCNRAETTVYNDKFIRSKSVWTLSEAEEDVNVNSDNRESFIPERTRVLDTRFSKALAYHMGNRLPTAQEVQLMLTKSNGVAIYEAATSRTFPGDEMARPIASKQSRSVIIVLMAVPTVFFLVWFLKRKYQ